MNEDHKIFHDPALSSRKETIEGYRRSAEQEGAEFIEYYPPHPKTVHLSDKTFMIYHGMDLIGYYTRP